VAFTDHSLTCPEPTPTEVTPYARSVACAEVKNTVMRYVASCPCVFFTVPPADHPPAADVQFCMLTSWRTETWFGTLSGTSVLGGIPLTVFTVPVSGVVDDAGELVPSPVDPDPDADVEVEVEADDAELWFGELLHAASARPRAATSAAAGSRLRLLIGSFLSLAEIAAPQGRPHASGDGTAVFSEFWERAEQTEAGRNDRGDVQARPFAGSATDG